MILDSIFQSYIWFKTHDSRTTCGQVTVWLCLTWWWSGHSWTLPDCVPWSCVAKVVLETTVLCVCVSVIDWLSYLLVCLYRGVWLYWKVFVSLIQPLCGSITCLHDILSFVFWKGCVWGNICQKLTERFWTSAHQKDSPAQGLHRKPSFPLK